MSTGFLKQVTTANGPGLVLGVSVDRTQVLIVHKAVDASPELRAKHNPKATIINAWYPLADVQELAKAQAKA